MFVFICIAVIVPCLKHIYFIFLICYTHSMEKLEWLNTTLNISYFAELQYILWSSPHYILYNAAHKPVFTAERPLTEVEYRLHQIIRAKSKTSTATIQGIADYSPWRRATYTTQEYYRDIIFDIGNIFIMWRVWCFVEDTKTTPVIRDSFFKLLGTTGEKIWMLFYRNN